jgi:hypothetical protein
MGFDSHTPRPSKRQHPSAQADSKAGIRDRNFVVAPFIALAASTQLSRLVSIGSFMAISGHEQEIG